MFYARLQPRLRSSSVSLALINKFQWPCQLPSHSSTRTSRPYVSTASLPLLAQPSFWQSVIPKFLRKRQSPPSPEKLRRSKEWNPATYFIIMFLLIGSNAIQMIALKNDLRNFSRKADVNIELLQDVIERVWKGEKVNVGKLLGSGDEDKERQWEKVLQEFENDTPPWREKSKKRGRKKDQKQVPEQNVHDATEKKEMDPDDSFKESKADDLGPVTKPKEAGGPVAGNPAPGFY